MSSVKISQASNLSESSFDENITEAPPQPVTHQTDVSGDELMSQDVYLSAQEVLDGVKKGLQALGLVLNVLHVIVMTRKSMRSPASRYMVSMSVVQLIYIVLSLVSTVHRLLTPRVMTDVFYLVYTIYVGNYVMSCLRRLLYVLHCLVSTERLLAVLMPLKAKGYAIVTRPGLFIAVATVVVFVCNVHVALKLEVYETSDTDNSTFHSYRYTDVYVRHPHLLDTLNVASKVVFVYGTLLFLVVANIVLIVALRRHATKRREIVSDMDTRQRRERQMTVTILVSTLVFTFLCLPTVSNSVAYNLIPESYGPFTSHQYLFQFVQTLGAACYLLAFSTDFFTYVFLSTAYRNTLMRMLRHPQDGDVTS